MCLFLRSSRLLKELTALAVRTIFLLTLDSLAMVSGLKQCFVLFLGIVLERDSSATKIVVAEESRCRSAPTVGLSAAHELRVYLFLSARSEYRRHQYQASPGLCFRQLNFRAGTRHRTRYVGESTISMYAPIGATSARTFPSTAQVTTER